MIAIIFFGEHNFTKVESNLKDPPKIVTADVTFQIFNNLKVTLFSCKFLFITNATEVGGCKSSFISEGSKSMKYALYSVHHHRVFPIEARRLISKTE